MKRKINAGTVLFRIWMGIWLAALIGSRLFLLFSDKIKITDPAGYFEGAMIKEEAMQPSGFSLAMLYQNSLKVLFMFIGNRIEAVPVYHAVLQIAALLLLVAGSRRLFGKMAAFTAGTALLLLPQLFYSIDTVSPENFYLFLAALLFFILCLLIRKLLGKTLAEIAVKKREKEAAETEKQIEITVEAEEKEESKSEQKTVTFLENPLPLPKKHVRKKMDFKEEAEEGAWTESEDDFDFPIKAGDDFDF